MSKLQIKMKKWVDANGVAHAVGVGAVEEPVTPDSVITAIVLGEDTVRMAKFTIDEWNNLPFVWLEESGPAPRHGVTL